MASARHSFYATGHHHNHPSISITTTTSQLPQSVAMTTSTQTVHTLSACSSPIACTSSLPEDSGAAAAQAPTSTPSIKHSEQGVFEDCTIGFPDQSHWVIKEPLSRITMQRTDSPCEAKQVFSALRVKDSSDSSMKDEEAVIKIRFQYVSRTYSEDKNTNVFQGARGRGDHR